MEQINNVSDYLNLLKRFESYSEKYYRGQLEKYSSIPPTIARDSGYLLNEYEIYDTVTKRNEFKDLKTPLEKLSKLQHYGFPTRLVDLTIDSLTALYFAVENINDLSPGNVYLYLVEGHQVDSKEVRILSILPTILPLNIKNIIIKYKELFKESISDKEVIKIVNKPIIIKYSNSLQKTSQRLHNQKATFLICGNEVTDNIINNSLISLDTIKPNMVIRIPYEYKKEIKDELDLKHGISESTIYPELSSFAKYIREKYKKENILLKEKYNIVEIKDVSHAKAKRISIVIVLNETLRINLIRNIIIDIFEKCKKGQNVIWIYVARTEEDYITNNWILRAQWIDSNLDKEYRPMTLQYFEDGYYWDYEKYFINISEFNNKYVFKDDKILFVSCKKIWEKLMPIFKRFLNSFENYTLGDFNTEVSKHELEIDKLYMIMQNLGESRNKDFNDFIHIFICVITLISNFKYSINQDLNNKMIQCYFKDMLQEVESKTKQINQGFPEWERKLKITKQDYQNIHLNIE